MNTDQHTSEEVAGSFRAPDKMAKILASNAAHVSADEIELLDWAWTILANAGGGDWTRESKDWQEASAKWRDEYHKNLSARRSASESEKLLPCPFCGSEAVMHDKGQFWVSCSYVGVCPVSLYDPKIHGCTYKADAIRIWNRRAAHASEVDAKQLAVVFHNIYERLAPDYGYETRKETRDFDPTTPNGRLMVAVCSEILKYHLPPRTRERGKARLTKYREANAFVSDLNIDPSARHCDICGRGRNHPYHW